MTKIESYKGESTETRACRLWTGDEIYLNTKAMKDLGFQCELDLGETITLPFKAQVTKRYTHKKYPNKKWWQFWLKQEEYVDGYNLMIM
jgi:hypothetical protein